MLHDVKGWHAGVTCAPTMIGAVTGLPVEEVAKQMSEKAIALHVKDFDPYSKKGTPVPIWYRVLLDLKVPLSEHQQLEHMDKTFWMAPKDWFSQKRVPQGVFIHFARGLTIRDQTHVFATCGDSIVDTYTEGRVEKFTETPPGWDDFRIVTTTRAG